MHFSDQCTSWICRVSAMAGLVILYVAMAAIFLFPAAITLYVYFCVKQNIVWLVIGAIISVLWMLAGAHIVWPKRQILDRDEEWDANNYWHS